MAGKYAGKVRYCRSCTVSTMGSGDRTGTVPPPWWTTSTPTSWRGSQVASTTTRHARRRASSEATTSSWRAATSRWAAAKPGSTNSRVMTSGAASCKPMSCRARYSSEPPTSPGRHHSRLTPTASSVTGEPSQRCERASASERAANICAGGVWRGRGTQSQVNRRSDASERAPAPRMRATRRQPRSGYTLRRRHAAWPGNATTACVAGERKERPAWPGNAVCRHDAVATDARTTSR